MDQSISTCADCGQSPGTIRRLRKHYCPECWINHCNFRFRKRLYEFIKNIKCPTRPIQNVSDGNGPTFGPPERVLIYYDSSPWAKALLSLVRDAILANSVDPSSSTSQETGRQKNLPFPFVFTVLFIYEGVNEYGTGALESNSNLTSGTLNNLEELRSWLRRTKSEFDLDFPLVVSSLEKSLSSFEGMEWKEIPSSTTETETDISVYFPFDPDLNSQLSSVVDNIKTTTSRLDFLYCLRQNMIISTAKHLKLSKVFLPDQQTSMSVKMFSMMSLGRGAQVAEQMSLITKVDGVELVRVMMDLTSDDLLDYLSSLDRIGMENLVAGNKSRRIDSIRSQCEDFILTLQKDYPSTVPTLARIGVKLDSTLLSSSDPQVSKCPLCKLRHDQGSESESIGFCYGCSKILGEMKDASILCGMLEPR